MPASFLPLPPQTILDRNVLSVDKLIDQLGGLFGQPEDPEIRQICRDCLDEAATRMNAAGIWLFNKKEWSAVGLTQGQTIIELPADWGWALDRPQVYDADGKLSAQIEWVGWENFRERAKDAVGKPEFASILSELDRVVHVYPAIDVAKVGSVSFSYVTRLGTPSASNDLLMTEEAREALLTGARYFLMQYRYKDKPAVVQPYQQDFNTILRAAKYASGRAGSCETVQFRVEI